MSKFLRIVGENLNSIENPHGIFFLKLVNDKGEDIGYEPIELRGTTYATDLFLKIKDILEKGQDIEVAPEEDNEIYAGAEALSDMGDRVTGEKLKKLKTTAKSKKPIIDTAIDRLERSLREVR